MLDRYKKPGGFDQLLELVEGFPLQKKEKFLALIEKESPRWARALRDRILSVDRIFTWPDEVISIVIRKIPPKNLAVAMRGLKSEQRAKVTAILTDLELRKIDNSLQVDDLKQEEINSSLVKLIDSARLLLKEQKIRAENFDPVLLHAPGAPNVFESPISAATAKSKKESAPPTVAAKTKEPPPEPPPSPATSALELIALTPLPTGSYSKLRQDFLELQKAMKDLLAENKKLQAEISTLKGSKKVA